MKKMFIFLVLLFLAGCTTDKITQKYSVYKNYYNDLQEGFTRVYSKEEINDFLNNNNLDEEVILKLNSYDESFFQEKMVIILYNIENSSSIKNSISKITFNDEEIMIDIIRTIPGNGTSDMSGYLFIIEFDLDDVKDKPFTANYKEA